jgi:hypothetical protein
MVPQAPKIGVRKVEWRSAQCAGSTAHDTESVFPAFEPRARSESQTAVVWTRNLRPLLQANIRRRDLFDANKQRHPFAVCVYFDANKQNRPQLSWLPRR